MSALRRIQRDSAKEELVKQLTTGDSAVFKEIWRLLLFAASLGIHAKRRKPLEKVDSGKAMPETYFSAPAWKGLLYLISLVETDDSECLRSSEEAKDALVTAFEEYANSGLEIIETKMATSVSHLDDLVSLVLEAPTTESKQANVVDLI
mgnify:CR=1 FL=1